MEKRRRRRINQYKKILLGVFLMCIFFPLLTSIFLILKVNSLENRIDILAGEDNVDANIEVAHNEELVDKPKTYLDGYEIEEASSGDLENTSVDIENPPISMVDDTKVIVSNGKKVYLTFDDGPSIYTDEILDILIKYKVKATFFVIGRDESYYKDYQRIVNEGHTLGMHTYSHEYDKIYDSPEAFSRDIDKLSNLLYYVTGERSTLFRFPGGSSNNMIKNSVDDYIQVLNNQGIVYYDWNALSRDAESSSYSADQLVANIMEGVENNNNSVVLMHDVQKNHTTVDALPKLIETLQSEGYEILPINDNTPLIQHIPYDNIEE